MRATGTSDFIPLSLADASGSPTSLPPPHTQPSWPPLLHCHCLLRDLSRSQKAYPILLPEGPTEGYWSIVPHKPVPSHPSKYPTTPLRPFQIIDKPTDLHSCFHPLQQRDDLLVFQMMRHQRTNDDVHRLLRSIHHSIACYPCDSELLRRGLHCCTRSIRIQIDPR